jgi:hypothetical protein
MLLVALIEWSGARIDRPSVEVCFRLLQIALNYFFQSGVQFIQSIILFSFSFRIRYSSLLHLNHSQK